jgi:hypothetical protein
MEWDGNMDSLSEFEVPPSHETGKPVPSNTFGKQTTGKQPPDPAGQSYLEVAGKQVKSRKSLTGIIAVGPALPDQGDPTTPRLDFGRHPLGAAARLAKATPSHQQPDPPSGVRPHLIRLRSPRSQKAIIADRKSYDRAGQGVAVERLRIFVSSPGDVGPERAVAAAVIERLQLQFRGRVVLETYLWERSLLLATETFQSQILDICEADLAVFILWSRTGFALPAQFQRQDGSRYESGTEYEFEHALAGYERAGRPEIIFYLKTADVQLSVRDHEKRKQQTADLDAVNGFVERRFRNVDGTFKSAYREFENTARFEDQFEQHVRDWIRRRVRDVELSGDQQWTGSPFRGLQPFDFEHALIYCGRTGLITEVIDALRERAGAGRGFLMIIGMSGAGKSSLVRAGVLPMLARPRVVDRVIEWRRAVFRPSDSQQGVWASLGAALTAEHALPDLVDDDAELAPLLRQPRALIAAISRALERATERAREHALSGAQNGVARLILVVDQFEEIFDETLTADERGEFAEVLSELVQSGQVWALATLRADLYARCAELPQVFRDLLAERGGVFTVVGPRPPEVAQMIRQPAAMAGLKFEKRGDPEEGLDDVLRDAAAEHPSVLPLLEFTLDELWKRSCSSRILRFRDYEDLGALHGALRHRADEEFERLPEAARGALHQLLSAIVRIDPSDERVIVEGRVSRARFGDGTP